LPFHKAANKPENEKEMSALLVLVLPILPRHKKNTAHVAPFVSLFRQQNINPVVSFDFFVSSLWIFVCFLFHHCGFFCTGNTGQEHSAEKKARNKKGSKHQQSCFCVDHNLFCCLFRPPPLRRNEQNTTPHRRNEQNTNKLAQTQSNQKHSFVY
jgi:hypothetical protein